MAVLKFIGGPGSLTFLGVCLLAGVVLLKLLPRRHVIGRLWLGAVIFGYALLALPFVASAITRLLPPCPSVQLTSIHGVDALIVLDGDNRRGRVREAKTAYEVTRATDVWVFGSAWMLDPLQQAGIPYNHIRYGGDPPTTRAQMERVKAFLAEGHHAALIASRVQLPRVTALAAALELHLPLIASPIDDEPPTTGAARFVPTYIALRTSRDAIYELAAIRYYRFKGWIA